MHCGIQRDLDPLDLEIVERAFQCVSEAMRSGFAKVEFENHKELERALRFELAQMVRASGIDDADVLLDLLIEGLREKICTARLQSQPSGLDL